MASRRQRHQSLAPIVVRVGSLPSLGLYTYFLVVLLLLSLWSIPVVQAGVKIFNATALATPSIGTDNKYQHQVILIDHLGTSDELDDVLIFRWDNPTNGVLNAALEHTTSSTENKPSWLALGFFDGFRNTVPIFDETLDAINGQAVVGTFFFANPAVFKYSLGNPHGKADSLNGGVSLLPDAEETLIFQNMEQGLVNNPDDDGGTQVIRTILMFSKNMDEGADIEEAVIQETGDNIFTWAMGPPGMETLGMHDERGAFRLNFEVPPTAPVDIDIDASTTATTTLTEPQPESQQESPATTATATESATAIPAPSPMTKFDILNATDTLLPIANQDTAAGTPYAKFDHEVELGENLMFYWANPTIDGIFDARLEHKAESAATAPSWLSLGFYDVMNNPRPVTSDNFVMAGSTAIIGDTWREDNPQICTLGYNHNQAGIIQPLDNQSAHLIESSLLQFTDTSGEGVVFTTLSFKKNMKNPAVDEPPIVAIGDNIFLWAMGPPGAEKLGMHSEYGAFRLDLMAASIKDDESGGSTTVAPIASISVVNASADFVTSTDDTFDYEVRLEQDVIFRWEAPDPETGIFTGRLDHSTKFVEAAPAWLGFGFPNPIDTSTWMLMQNTYAIIGMLPTEKVEKYSLGVSNNHTKGFVQALPLEQQTLKASRMVQSHNADTGVYTTSLTFAKLLLENNSPMESPIWTDGENRFLWAVGNALTKNPNLGMHRDFGAMTLDFTKVAKKASSAVLPTTPVPVPSTTNPDAGDGATDPYPAPVIAGQCSSSIFKKSGKSIKLTPDLVMHWQINDSDGSGFSEFGIVPSLTIVLEYNGLCWLGFGISPTSQAHSLGATAIIGIPSTKDSPQLKYNVSSYQTEGVVPLADQTLIESYIQQDAGPPGLTTLRFTKALTDGEGEVKIKRTGLNFFSFAVGSGNSLGYHKHRGSFQLDLSECYDVPPGSDPSSAQNADTENSKAKTALKAHAIMASIAWGFAMPCAVSVAWFRQLIPTTWIYIHVSFNLLTFLLTLMTVLVGVAAVNSRETSYHLTKSHHVVGILLFVGYTFQVGNGFLRPPVERKAGGEPVERVPSLSFKKPRSPREWWHFIHRSLGIIMMLVGIFQIASGMKIFDEDFESGRDNFFWYWTYVALFALVMISLKIWVVVQNKKTRGNSSPWVEDRASQGIGIDSMMHSDPDGMHIDDEDCVVLEIPSRSGESTLIRGARRVPANGLEARDDSDNMTVEIT